MQICQTFLCVFMGVVPRIRTLTEWLRHFNDLSVGETAAPARFSQENAEGEGMPPLLVIKMTRHVVARVKQGSTPINTYMSST